MQKVNARVLGSGMILISIIALSTVPPGDLTQYATLSFLPHSSHIPSRQIRPVFLLTVNETRPVAGYNGNTHLRNTPFHLNPLLDRYVAGIGIIDSRSFFQLSPVELKRLDSETLWLARGIYSESKRPEEQELIAWIIRNRVETRYRGKTSYRDVVLDPYQFSAFNPDWPERHLFTGLRPEMKLKSWQTALAIAHEIRHLSPRYRPFSIKTRHFFSELSLCGTNKPEWTQQGRLVRPLRPYAVSEHRFRFFEDVN